MTKERLQRLLKLDGLIDIESASSDKYDPGTHLLAAFVTDKTDSNSDYHYLRLFKEGWFERKGHHLRLRNGVNLLYFESLTQFERDV